MTAKSTDLSLDINEGEYIDRVETKIESPKAEVITPNSDKIFPLSMDNDEGSSVDGPSENGTRACDDNEFKDESWIDHCETKIIADDHLKCLKEILISSVARTITNDKIGDEIQDIYDSKKNKSRGSYEITSATSFFLFNTKNSKKTAEKTGVNNSPVKVKETQVSMLYQMGVEAIGKPLEPKSHEEYPLQLADDSSSVQNAALAAEDSRSASAKAGWASIRQESGELENYLLEEDDDENVIIHLGTEFAQDAMEGGKNEDMTTVDYKDQYEGTRKTDSSSKTVLSPGGKKCDKNNLAEEKEEDTSVYDSEDNKTCTSDKLSQLENVLSNMSQEDSLQMVKQEQGANSVEKHTYKTQVSAESKHLNMKNSDIENIATEGKTFQAKDDRIHTAQFGKSVQKYPSQVLSKDGQTNIGEISESQSQEHLTDEKITRQQTEQLNLSQSIAINAQGNSKQYDAKESNKKDSIPQMKQIEVERKFRISTDCRQKLMDMGAVMAKENKFSDKYFDDIRYKMTLSDSWLRQRNGRWEFKIPPRHMSKKDPSSQLLEITSETEIMKHLCKLYNCCGSVDDRTLEQLMNKLCLDSFATFTTIRQTYFLPNCTVQLDIADFGFEVGEIEVVVSDESRITDALNIIDDVAKKLGVTSKDRFP